MVTRSRLKVAVLVLLLAVSLNACSSVGVTAYNSLTGLKAAYVATNGARIEYCHGKDPYPKICVDSYKPLLATYETLKTGSALLAAYELTKTADAKTKLQAFIPVIAAQAIEVVTAFTPATEISPPSPPK